MHNYEIEIKSLLLSKERADELISQMKASDPAFKSLGQHKQLNHYFIQGNLSNLSSTLAQYLLDSDKTRLTDIVSKAKTFSVRTRWADGKVIFVIKATVDDTSSSNGTARLEFEVVLEQLSIEKLDELLLDCGFVYQAKWSRERREFKYKNLSVSVDKNAGYGYLAEFESVITDESKAEETKTLIRNIMASLGIEELPQDRLERMFKFYNEHWQDYYGADKTFIIE